MISLFLGKISDLTTMAIAINSISILGQSAVSVLWWTAGNHLLDARCCAFEQVGVVVDLVEMEIADISPKLDNLPFSNLIEVALLKHHLRRVRLECLLELGF